MTLYAYPTDPADYALIGGGNYYTTRRNGPHPRRRPAHHCRTAGPRLAPHDRPRRGLRAGLTTLTSSVSWHVGVDTDSILPCLPKSYTAWHAAGYNSRTFGIEISKLNVDWSAVLRGVERGDPPQRRPCPGADRQGAQPPAGPLHQGRGRRRAGSEPAVRFRLPRHHERRHPVRPRRQLPLRPAHGLHPRRARRRSPQRRTGSTWQHRQTSERSSWSRRSSVRSLSTSGGLPVGPEGSKKVGAAWLTLLEQLARIGAVQASDIDTDLAAASPRPSPRPSPDSPLLTPSRSRPPSAASSVPSTTHPTRRYQPMAVSQSVARPAVRASSSSRRPWSSVRGLVLPRLHRPAVRRPRRAPHHGIGYVQVAVENRAGKAFLREPEPPARPVDVVEDAQPKGTPPA